MGESKDTKGSIELTWTGDTYSDSGLINVLLTNGYTVGMRLEGKDADQTTGKYSNTVLKVWYTKEVSVNGRE